MSDGDDRESPVDDDMEGRLADIERRAGAARERQKSAEPKPMLDTDVSRGLGTGLSAAYAIIGLPLVGAGVGWLIDRAVGTTFIVVIGVVGGLVGGIFHAVQLSNRL